MKKAEDRSREENILLFMGCQKAMKVGGSYYVKVPLPWLEIYGKEVNGNWWVHFERTDDNEYKLAAVDDEYYQEMQEKVK